MEKRTLILGIACLLVLAGCSKGVPESGAVTQSVSSDVGLNKGQLAPDFSVKTVDNLEIHLRDFKKQGKPMVIYFLATWCPYCQKDFTTLSQVYKGYENDVLVIAMSLDLKEDADLVKEYRGKYSGLEKVMFAPGKENILHDYQVKFTTTKYALNKNGRIIYAGSGPLSEQQWKTLLDALKSS